MLPVSSYLIKLLLKKSVLFRVSVVITGGLFIMSAVAVGYGMYNVWLLCVELSTAVTFTYNNYSVYKMILTFLLILHFFSTVKLACIT